MSHELKCPVCGVTTNRSGDPFRNESALAFHVAGSIRYADKLHVSWARHNVPEISLSQSIPRLAEDLAWPLSQALKAERAEKTKSTPEPILVLREVERQLHRFIRHRLVECFRVDREKWWVEGVPIQIRTECVQRREIDPAREEPYTYTYLIDLKSILEKNWTLFEQDHARIRHSLKSKKDLLNLLVRLNGVRNRHAHPTRSPDRGSVDFGNDRAFVEQAAQLLSDFCAGSR